MPDEVMGAAMRAGRDSGESGASAKVHAPYLVTRGLVKGYGEGAARMEVLRGIDVEIARGEICVLLGPSGSGKSTFLNLLGGLEAADGGSIEVIGKEDAGEKRRHRHHDPRQEGAWRIPSKRAWLRVPILQSGT